MSITPLTGQHKTTQTSHEKIRPDFNWTSSDKTRPEKKKSDKTIKRQSQTRSEEKETRSGGIRQKTRLSKKSREDTRPLFLGHPFKGLHYNSLDQTRHYHTRDDSTN